MYLDDAPLTPRDRIDGDMLQRILGEPTDPISNPRQTPQPSRTTWGLYEMPLAMVYAPLQQFRKLYDRETALKKGTIFTELDLPFRGESVMKGGACHD